MSSLAALSATPVVEVVRGSAAILALQEPLEAFASQCRQPDALHWLDYFLRNRNWWCTRPYLVIVRIPGSAGKPLHAGNIQGAALFFEYGTRGIRTGAFVSDDLVAPESNRGRIAALAALAIVEEGAHMMVSTYWRAASDSYDPGPLLLHPNLEWAERCRTGRRRLQLGQTFEQTLASFGKSTRVHFRYYRKRFEARFAPVFLGDARGSLSEAEFLALNAGSCYPADPVDCLLKLHNSVHQPNGFLSTLRDSSGCCISAVGGWRSGDTVVIQWQANSMAYEKYSLVTVMRALCLEYEVSRGTREMSYLGGTSHSMHHAFAPEAPFDMFVRRCSLWASALYFAGRLFLRATRFAKHKNFLVQGICESSLEWHVAQKEVPAIRLDEAHELRSRRTA
jgi:hypothetical protein